MKNPGRWYCLCGHPYDLAYDARAGTLFPRVTDARAGSQTTGRPVTICQTCGRNLATTCYLRRRPPAEQ